MESKRQPQKEKSVQNQQKQIVNIKELQLNFDSPNIMSPIKKPTSNQNKDKQQNTVASNKTINFQLPIENVREKKPYLYTGCNCRKSECLKMYCTCFSDGKMCDQKCLCDSCLNKYDNTLRSEAIVDIITKNPLAFSKQSEKISNSQSICNCIKSNCLKKYCECLRRGKKCSSQCRCKECKNIKHKKQYQQNSKKKIKF